LIKAYDGSFKMGKKIVERDALIRELVAALAYVRDWRVANGKVPDPFVDAALAKAKDAGYEP
jgi:hypothetical protein